MSNDHPGIVQHGHLLANGCSLIERIDNGRPEGFDAPPQRRYRLVIDAGGDTLDDLYQILEHIAERLERRSKGGTSGSPDRGYHWEMVERDVDHDTFIAELKAWRHRGRAEVDDDTCTGPGTEGP